MIPVRISLIVFATAAAFAAHDSGIQPKANEPQFLTSDRCLACHNGLVDASGQDVSIGFHWRASVMANSSRDPYWQASIRRETIDHPESKADIEDECSVCHMPITRYEAKLRGRKGEVFTHFPISTDGAEQRQAADGISCAVCHQIVPQNFGKRESYNGGFVVHPPSAAGDRPEYGPFQIDAGRVRIMRSSTEGYHPEQADHIRDSELCATCHTLFTKALGPDGKVIGTLPEQMPYPEWLHSDYRDRQSCQSCHMPAIDGPAQIARVLGESREGARLHSFTGANFFLQGMLNRYREEANVVALPAELSAAREYTLNYLHSEAATVTLDNVATEGGRLRAEVVVHNRDGHKLPTAYPSRRAWLHFVVRDSNGRAVFESGGLNPDGSIKGDDNDADPAKFEPHYTEIREPGQVEIFESILGDPKGGVTTGLLTGVRYLKDNRLLPDGFDKRTAPEEVAVVGGALDDPGFTGGSARVRYSVPLNGSSGPFRVEAELWYQPIGFRWAHNLKPYAHAAEPRRFTGWYEAMQSETATVLARAESRTR